MFDIESYAILDARVGIRSVDDRWSVQVWGRNLTDEYYITNANYLGEFAYRLAGDPLTYGIRLSVKR